MMIPSAIPNATKTSVAELAHMVIDLTGSRSEITHKPLPIDDPIQRCPDISQAKSVLEWEPPELRNLIIVASSEVNTDEDRAAYVKALKEVLR